MGRKKKIEIENSVEIEQAREAVFSARGWSVRPWEVRKGDHLIVENFESGEKENCYVSNILVGTVEIRAILETKETPYGGGKGFVAYAARFDREIQEGDEARDWNRVIGHLRAGEVALSAARAMREDAQVLLPEAFGGIEQERARVETLRNLWEAKLEELEDFNERMAILKEEIKPIKKASGEARQDYRSAQRTLRKLERQGEEKAGAL